MGMYNLFKQYMDGYHRLAFTTDQWRSEFGQIVKGVADNHCPTVVEAMVDRLVLQGFNGADGDVARAEEIWKDQHLDLRQGEIHTEAAVQGDAFVLVWPDPDGDPCLYLNTADQMCVRYSDEVPGTIIYAGKVWMGDDEKACATLYYPDRIEKYITKAKVQGSVLPEKGTDEVWERRIVVVGQEATPDSEEYVDVEEAWPLLNPYDRVPIFHFPNGGAIGKYGKSELHDVVPLQDILNKDLSDRVIAQEFHSFPQRWAVGLEPEYDSDGNAVSPDTGPKRLWFSPDANGKFGQFDPMSLTGLVDVADSDRAEIARVSRTPQHFMDKTNTPPSGEALRSLEAPLMAKVEKRKDLYGAVWEDLMEFAVSLPVGDSEIDLEADWKDTTSVSEKEKAEEMVLWQTLEVPIQMIWKRMGFSPEEIKQMEEWKAENEAARADSFNAGLDTGNESAIPSPAPTTNGQGTGIPSEVLTNDITGQ